MTRLRLGPDAAGREVFVAAGAIAVSGPGPVALQCGGARIELGRVNAHTHLYSGLAPLGMPAPRVPPSNFVEILERVWWRLDRALDRASLAASARLYVAEALLSGTTTLIDHHESPAFIEGSLEVLAEAADALGARVALCYGATERNGGREEARRGLEECARFIESARGSPTLAGLVGLHASFTVSDDTIRDARALAERLGVGIHVHVAEDAADVADAVARGYADPVARLALPPGSIAAHAIHLSPEAVRRLAPVAWIVQNPRSNANNRVGYPASLVVTNKVALGTDGFPAAMDDEAAALRAAAVDPEATIAARIAAGPAMIAALFGRRFDLAPGAAADLVVREPDGRARHVLVEGRLVVEEGRLITGDLDEIRADAAREAARLWRRMEEL